MAATRRAAKSKAPLIPEKSTKVAEEKSVVLSKTATSEKPITSTDEPSIAPPLNQDDNKSSKTKQQQQPPSKPNLESKPELEPKLDSKPSLKRKELTNDFLRSQAKKARVQPPSAARIAATAENNLKDSIGEGLILISIGLNPGIMTGKTGHAYAHPSNRYWPTLHASGITPILHKPSETYSLQSLYGIGHTNIIPDLATQGGADLTAADYLAGAAVLDAKIRALRPQAVMIVGKGIWEEWFRYKRGRKMNKSEKDAFRYGWQDEALRVGRKKGEWDEGARTFVATTTSGLSSAHTVEERVAIWRPMGEWFAPRRERWVEEQKNKTEEKENGEGD